MTRDGASSDVTLYRVDPHWSGLRLDLFLKAMMPSVPRAKLQRFVASGNVLVNGEARPPRHRVREGDEVRFDARLAGERPDDALDVPLTILYEDDALVVADKPAGVHVHPVSGHRFDTLLSALRARRDADLEPGETITLAHRLDRDTSGVVLAAKTRAARQSLQRQFEAGVPEKTYLALARGWIASDEGVIDLPLLAAADPRAVVKALPSPAGKPARTAWVVRARLEDAIGRATFVELRPKSGRQHQLRAHLAAIGHPLLGDDRYGDRRPWPPLTRCALHAAAIAVDHPLHGGRVVFRSPLPQDLAAWVAARS